jgi:hypothetical protein
VTDAIDERRHQVEAWLRNANEAAEAFDRVAIALAHDLDAHHYEQQCKDG